MRLPSGHSLSSRAVWVVYLIALMFLGLFQLWDARLFVWYTDDFDYLDHIEQVKADPWGLFSPDYAASGRPLASIFFILLNALFGDAQVPQHVVLILIHVLSTWSLARLLTKLGYPLELTTLTGLLFLFNVSHYEVPYWMSCVSYMGCLVSGVWAVVAYKAWALGGSDLRLGGACFLILISTLFHAVGITFALLAPYYALRGGARVPAIVKSAWVFPLISVVLSILIMSAYPEHAQHKNVTQIDQILHVGELTLAYIGRAFLSPHWLSKAFVVGPTNIDVIAGFLILCMGCYLAYRYRSTPLDAIVWTTLAFPIFGGSTLEEFRSRYFYVANVGPSLMIAWVLIEAGTRIPKGYRDGWGRWLVPATGTVCLLWVSHGELDKTKPVFWAGIGRSYMATGAAKTGLPLLGKGILGSPENLAPIYYYRYASNAYFLGLDTRQVLEAGLNVYPNDASIVLLAETDQYISNHRIVPLDLVERVQNAGRIPVRVVSQALHNVASYLYNKEDYAAALRFYANALQVDPMKKDSTVFFANTLNRQNRHADAMTAYERYFELAQGAEMQDAIPGLLTIVNTTPKSSEAWAYLSSAYLGLGNIAEAGRAAAAGLDQIPSDPLLIQMLQEISLLHRDRGETKEANRIAEYLNKATSSLNPSLPDEPE